jgi:pSer/pThr/pTyr-binding forkhead associated (FHA) protein
VIPGVTPSPENQPSIAANGKLSIQVDANYTNLIELDLSGTEGHVIGRSDSKSSYLPDIDLAAFEALNKGVSRRHAAIVRDQSQLCVIDLSSVNGTFLNGERLNPETPYPLHIQDKLVLGELNLFFSKVE